ncbi:hypothetical protein DPPLL_17200 [Desulfofustis limnaeus]|uniref:SAF domain-containing protein n=2 Tax=Desulfofustis limnaeus TaxID=2740163 RepID=A0ABM7W8X1_9BACT|nr:hypothetical protein DPPLL_17200 [Desulfofustis limnaeus]
MTMNKLLIVILAALCCAAVPAAALEVTFRPAAEICGDTITIGDLAELSDDSALASTLAAQPVGPAPDPGQSLLVDTRTIIDRLVRQNRSLLTVLWQGSASVTVTRRFVTVAAEEILGAIDDYLEQNRHRLPEATIRFIPAAPPLPIQLPIGTLSVQVVPSNPGILSSSRFSLIYSVDNRVWKNFSVLGRVEAIAPVVVAVKTLKYDDLITRDAVAVEPRDLSQFPHATDQPELVVGSIVKRTIPSGTPVDTSAIEQPPLVRKGELVKILVTHKRLTLTATGIARADGRKHEMIRVQNSASNKLIYCRVQAPGLVEVTL